jgi:hypothetical protein
MPVVIHEAISRQSPSNDPARVAAVVPFDSRFAYFGTAAFVVGLLRSVRRSSPACGVIEAVANVLDTDTALFQEFCDRLSVYGDRTLLLFADGQAVEVPVF